jgi:exonuclease III
MYILCVYKTHSRSIFTFLKKIQNIIEHSLKHCPIIILGDFNVDILEDNNHAQKTKKTKKRMNRFHG